MAASPCSDEPWGYLATDVPDPPKCIAQCRDKFLQGLLRQHETFENVCEHLSDTGSTTGEQVPLFWSLYCCDSQLCGVDNLQEIQLDPNVNWFISSCQNIGYTSVTDPGPPEPTRSCSRVPQFSQDPRCQKQKDPDVVTFTDGDLQPSVSSTPVTRTVVATSSLHTITDPSLESSIDPSTGSEGGHQNTLLPTKIIVTISLSVFVGVFIIGLAIFCFLRSRNRPSHQRGGVRQLLQSRDSGPVQVHSDSPTPLVSPLSILSTNSKPLTPPPPLRERRMLDTGVVNRTSSLNRSHQGVGFPTSPVIALTKNSMVPRIEKKPTLGGAGASPALSPLGAARNESVWSTQSSITNPLGTATLGTSSISSSRSPVQRRDAQPLDLRGFSNPGPPPNRALPSTPLGSPTLNPASSTLHSAQPGNFGVALGLVSHNPAHGVILDPEARSLRELTEECERDSRNHSWGSWCGSTGGGNSPTLSPPKKSGKREFSGQRLKEGDLERLGGTY